MQVLSTSVTIPYTRQHGNFNRRPAYFENRASLPRSTHAQPLQQKFLRPVLPPLLLREKSFVCKGSAKISWVDENVMKKLMPYLKLGRIDAFGWNIRLSTWSAYWSIMLATKPGTLPDFKLFGLYYFMSYLTYVSGVVINDLADIDYDRKVERCKTRPLVSGEITPVQAWLFWAFLMSLLIPLVLQLNKLCIALTAVEQVLWLVYPFMKRVTFWTPAFLGLVQNWGATLGWAAVTGNLNDVRIFLPVHIAGICWTMVYETLYAHQDKNEDEAAGVKSIALLFGDSTRTWLLGFSTICIGSLIFAGYNAHIGWPFYLSMIPAFGHLLWKTFAVDLSNGLDCYKKFRTTKWFGVTVFVGMVLGRIIY